MAQHLDTASRSADRVKQTSIAFRSAEQPGMSQQISTISAENVFDRSECAQRAMSVVQLFIRDRHRKQWKQAQELDRKKACDQALKAWACATASSLLDNTYDTDPDMPPLVGDSEDDSDDSEEFDEEFDEEEYESAGQYFNALNVEYMQLPAISLSWGCPCRDCHAGRHCGWRQSRPITCTCTSCSPSQE